MIAIYLVVPMTTATFAEEPTLIETVNAFRAARDAAGR
jgi:hypothetical protein